MKLVPFEMIQAAKRYDPEAVIFVQRHFEGYITSRCLRKYIDERGREQVAVDDDLYYQAQIALFAAIAGFEFREPPESFQI